MLVWPKAATPFLWAALNGKPVHGEIMKSVVDCQVNGLRQELALPRDRDKLRDPRHVQDRLVQATVLMEGQAGQARRRIRGEGGACAQRWRKGTAHRFGPQHQRHVKKNGKAGALEARMSLVQQTSSIGGSLHPVSGCSTIPGGCSDHDSGHRALRCSMATTAAEVSVYLSCTLDQESVTCHGTMHNTRRRS